MHKRVKDFILGTKQIHPEFFRDVDVLDCGSLDINGNNRQFFIDAMSRFDYASGIGLCMKSLYGNIYCPDAPCLAEQKKTVFKCYTLDELNLRFEKPILLSFNDQGMNDSLKIFLYQNFSLPSPLETCLMEDRIIEIYRANRFENKLKYLLEQKLTGL
ncbi:MAG: hypothetical protein WC865_09000 [Bacteroidales bacterium]